MLKIANKWYRDIGALFAGMIASVERPLFGVLEAAGGIFPAGLDSLKRKQEKPARNESGGHFGIMDFWRILG